MAVELSLCAYRGREGAAALDSSLVQYPGLPILRPSKLPTTQEGLPS